MLFDDPLGLENSFILPFLSQYLKQLNCFLQAFLKYLY